MTKIKFNVTIKKAIVGDIGNLTLTLPGEIHGVDKWVDDASGSWFDDSRFVGVEDWENFSQVVTEKVGAGNLGSPLIHGDEVFVNYYIK